ncbi:MAG: hypothetical protein ACI4UE_04275 [Candidatus Scatovivens sp.]
MKKLITIAIALLLIIVFTACKNNRTEVVTSTTSEMSTTEAITNVGYLSDFPTNNFVSSNAKKVFKIIDNDEQKSSGGYNIIINYLLDTSPKLVDSNQVWKLGNYCFLILNRNRMLILSNSTQIDAFSYVVLDNVDYRYTKSTPKFLNDYQDVSLNTDEWIIDDMTYSHGKFFYLGNKLFEAEDLKAESQIRLLGCSSSSDGTNFIAAKSKNKIWIIKENNHEFEFELIAKDAVDHSEQLSYPMRNDCYKSFYNNDAVQYERSIIYRSIRGGLFQVDIWNNSITTSKIDDSENPVLVYDCSGVFWLQIEDFGEVESLTDLIKLSNHPEHCISKDGALKKYTLCDY